MYVVCVLYGPEADKETNRENGNSSTDVPLYPGATVTTKSYAIMNHDSGFIIGITDVFCKNPNRTHT